MLLAHGIERVFQSYPGTVRRLRGEKVVERAVLLQSVRMRVEQGAQSFWSATPQRANGVPGGYLVFRYGVARELIEPGHEAAGAARQRSRVEVGRSGVGCASDDCSDEDDKSRQNRFHASSLPHPNDEIAKWR